MLNFIPIVYLYMVLKKINKLYSWTKLTCIIHLKKTMRKEDSDETCNFSLLVTFADFGRLHDL